MDFLKETISDAGEKAAKEAMVDQASSAIKSALGGNVDSKIIDQASTFVKSSLNDKDGNKTTTTQQTSESTLLTQAQDLIKKTVTKESKTEESKDGQQTQTEKTTVKTDYVDKGISMIEEKLFNISADKQNKERNEQIAGYVRAGIEKYNGKDDDNNNSNNNNNNNNNNQQ